MCRARTKVNGVMHRGVCWGARSAWVLASVCATYKVDWDLAVNGYRRTETNDGNPTV